MDLPSRKSPGEVRVLALTRIDECLGVKHWNEVKRMSYLKRFAFGWKAGMASKSMVGRVAEPNIYKDAIFAVSLFEFKAKRMSTKEAQAKSQQVFLFYASAMKTVDECSGMSVKPTVARRV